MDTTLGGEAGVALCEDRIEARWGVRALRLTAQSGRGVDREVVPMQRLWALATYIRSPIFRS